MIPNPTNDQWLKKIGQKAKASWRITRLMEIFQAKLEELTVIEGFEPSNQLFTIIEDSKKIFLLNRQDGGELCIHSREAVHDALDKRTQYLLSLTQAEVLGVLVAHVTTVVEVLADPNSPLNTIVLANKEDALLSYYFSKVRPAVIGKVDSNWNHSNEEEMDKRNIIWISLIFRMLCWLLLHDFDKADVKIVPTDLKGSRMPVFIG